MADDNNYDISMYDDEYADEDEESFEGSGSDGEGDLDHELEELQEEAADSVRPNGGSTVLEILRAMQALQDRQTSGDGENSQAQSGQQGFRVGGIGVWDFARLLGVNPRRIEEEEEEEEEEEDDDYGWGSRRYRHRQWFEEVKEPQKAGVDLLLSGEFGRVGNKIKARRGERNMTRALNDWRTGRRQSSFRKEDYVSSLVPNSNGVAVATYYSNIYSGQYSTDSSFFYTCGQDFRLRVYDTTSPLSRQPVVTSLPGSGRRGPYTDGHETTMKVIKTVQGHPGQWTITDSHLSPDNERMIYASITSTVYMTSTLDSSPEQIPIRFSDPPVRRRRGYNILGRDDDDDDGFGIWSCKFSADGNEVVAGGSGKIFVYDLLADRRTVKISAHNDDVNSCCWADTASGNVLISASDDTFIKVWDRRSLGTSQKPSGVLVGHTEGITNVSAKGDGRYVISNGKDQALRLWDLRKMRTSAEFDRIENEGRYYGVRNFDYRRNSYYPKPKYSDHPKDCSVMSYRGHAVLRTLIRCHFSPAETTGGQYLYSGSADGRIHIWSLDGRVVQILDRSKSLPISFDPSGPEPPELGSTGGTRSNVCVRDVSWHSQLPILMSAGWEGGRGGSTVARHEWKGLSKLGGSLEDWTEKAKLERAERAKRRAANRASGQRVPGAFESNDEEMDEE